MDGFDWILPQKLSFRINKIFGCIYQFVCFGSNRGVPLKNVLQSLPLVLHYCLCYQLLTLFRKGFGGVTNRNFFRNLYRKISKILPEFHWLTIFF